MGDVRLLGAQCHGPDEPLKLGRLAREGLSHECVLQIGGLNLVHNNFDWAKAERQNIKSRETDRGQH